MIVYHGSSLEIMKPEISYSKAYLDFGKGFYVTTFRSQAEKWALRKSIRQEKEAIVNIYDLQDNFGEHKVLSFESENEKWLDFVCDCRKGMELNQEYDIIIGSVADDDVFKTVDMYFRGLWSKKKALEELRYYKMNDQICFANQKVLDNLLIFQESYRVVN
jgi:hypothetical protein